MPAAPNPGAAGITYSPGKGRTAARTPGTAASAPDAARPSGHLALPEHHLRRLLRHRGCCGQRDDPAQVYHQQVRRADRRREGPGLPRLDYYYFLHLDEDHEAASVDGLSVEAAHIEGIARFIRESELFNLNLPQIRDGFLQIMEGMAHWWTELTSRSQEMA